MDYVRRIWHARHFWVHLALADLRARWRRSFFGALWSVLQPLGMTLLLAVVFGRIFGADIVRYAPYIFSGLIFWEFVGSTVVGGSLAFVQADAYIRQTKNPLAIYTLRTTLVALAVYGLGCVGLLSWVAVVFPGNIGWCWLAILASFPLMISIGWAIATCIAYFATRYRDIPHALGMVLQALWFASPVYFEDSVLRNAGLPGLVDYNPIYHVLEISRAPLLRGEWPSSTNFAWVLGAVVICSVIAMGVGKRLERTTIFYL